MTQEELTNILSQDNADDIWTEELPVDIPGIDPESIKCTYLVPNLPTLEKALLAIPDVYLIGKSEQWLYLANTEDHPKLKHLFDHLIYIEDMLPFNGYAYSYKEILTRYNNNPIDFTTI